MIIFQKVPAAQAGSGFNALTMILVHERGACCDCGVCAADV
jgi:hypothetical protein